jgi:hypothetical protein
MYNISKMFLHEMDARISKHSRWKKMLQIPFYENITKEGVLL